MKLQEVFDQLSGGEFSQISIGGQDAGVINEANYQRVLNHINLGLTSLYTRFNLKERRLSIPLQAESDTYRLDVDDILKIEKILVDSGEELELNHEGNVYSCFTPSLNTVRVPQIILVPDSTVPEALHTDGITVVYRANHPKVALRFGYMNITTKTIELPSSHLSALLYFVASRVHTPMSLDAASNAAMNWYGKYEAACVELEGKGVQVNVDNTNYRLQRNGWV